MATRDLPLTRIRSRASGPHHDRRIRVRQTIGGLDIRMTEAQAVQLVTAVQGSLDWCERTRRRHPEQERIRDLIREVLTELINEGVTT